MARAKLVLKKLPQNTSDYSILNFWTNEFKSNSNSVGLAHQYLQLKKNNVNPHTQRNINHQNPLVQGACSMETGKLQGFQ